MSRADDRALREALDALLDEPFEILDIRAHPLRSSCPLIEISLRCARTGNARWLLKDLGGRPPEAGPAFLYDERREIAAYRLLGERSDALPRCMGAHVDRGLGLCWLFVEHVDAAPLWQSASRPHWCEAAEWLAGLHERERVPRGSCWLRYDESYFAPWMERAQAFAPDAGLADLEAAHDAAIERLASGPAVTIHGDYYPSNVLVRRGAAGGICPLDLELAGVGPAALDLAALCTGLPERLAGAALDAYRSALRDPCPGEELRQLLACARLHLAVRWLGWMPGHQPPAHQLFDWAAEAHAAGADVLEQLALGVGA